MKVVILFDGLNPQELTNKLNYLHYATSHPFKPKSYLNYKKNIKNIAKMAYRLQIL